MYNGKNMTREEAERIIREYVPQKPTAYYYNDPYDDGKFCGSGWVYEYPPVSSRLIDAILERDKNCRPYDLEKDSTEIKDEKFCDELAERFTSLMKRADESGHTAVDEYRKKNSHLFSMVTEYRGEKITVIPMKNITKCEFEKECEKASSRLGLANYSICVHKDENDSGREIFTHFPLCNRKGLTFHEETAISDLLSFCEYFSKYSGEEDDSEFREYVSGVCDEVKTALGKLKLLATADYLQRIKNYAKSQGAKPCVK